MNNKSTRQQRKTRISSQIRGTTERPRLSVYRSNVTMYAQIIDDAKGATIVGVSEKTLKTKGTKTEKAKALGLELAKLASGKKVTKVIFDKGAYKYHGRVRALAEGAREGGLEF